MKRKTIFFIILFTIFTLLLIIFLFKNNNTKEKSIITSNNNIKIDIKYPTYNNKKLNKKIDKVISSYTNTIEDYPKYTNDNLYTLFIEYKEYKYKNYISIVFNIEYYLGGAHPNHNIETIIYNTKDHNFITINNLISDNKNIISNLSKISRRELEKNKIFQDKTLKAMMLDGTTPNKKNFTKLIFSNKGLILYFERYQIAPYYLGEYNITIPYNNLNINI